MSRWLYKINAYGNIITEYVNKPKKDQAAELLSQCMHSWNEDWAQSEWIKKEVDRKTCFFLTLSAKQLDCT